MRPIAICGINELLDVVGGEAAGFQPQAWLSILNLHLTGAQSKKVVRAIKIAELTHVSHRLMLTFDDVQHANEDPTDSFLIPRREDVEQIIAFALKTKGMRTLVHCAAGISRSTAAAIIIQTVDGYDPRAIATWLKTIRPMAHPNRLMLNHYAETFNEEDARFFWQALRPLWQEDRVYRGQQ